MAIRVSVETPLQDDVRDLVRALNTHMLPLSPIEFQFKMTVEQMAEPDTTVFVARDEDGKAVGCGALKMHGNRVGELKRMFTRPEVRGKRIGSHLVDAIVELARAKGASRLVLETGTGPGFDAAWRLYENSGFERCGVVLDYPDSEYSAFFEKRLVEA
ncbi:GNAT family N-acetyltransferase [Ochrobactrum sp. BTU1]|jgi:putative acetyltransferase|uniref:GNAT family N-acetyltransferase n=1 Tax=Ochrobactrum sp. BTU1 TaxID=2840456 RepID=UPI001C052DE3|nr:GNAT family N-acetyltransferase [Ochrobactrum sp. BTU1]